jgi:hypothetical protein
VGNATVPVERVRLGTETVTEQHEVNEQVRKERIEEPAVGTDVRRDASAFCLATWLAAGPRPGRSPFSRVVLR